jgi:cytochrome c
VKQSYLFIGLAAAAALLLSACAGEVNGMPEPRTSDDRTIAQGYRLIVNYGCGACHMIPGIVGANATVGPPLDHFYERRYIAGKLPNTLDNLTAWIQNPQRYVPGNAMPDLGVSQADARSIAAYLYH